MYSENECVFEFGIVIDLLGWMMYGLYLVLDQLFMVQYLVSELEYYDEMLFIIQYQIMELWFKQLLYELFFVWELFVCDDLWEVFKCIVCVKCIQDVMMQQWLVFVIFIFIEYVQFCGVLGNLFGFQFVQYWVVEFVFGNKNEKMLMVFVDYFVNLVLFIVEWEKFILYDEFLCFVVWCGLLVLMEIFDCDVWEFYWEILVFVLVICEIYQDLSWYWDLYEVCEDLVDFEDNFQFWCFWYFKMVVCMIGMKVGIGGFSGVGFLQCVFDLMFFFEFYMVCIEIGC